MKRGLSALVLCACLAYAGPVRATTLPDSCGADNIKFDVKAEKSDAAPARPAEGKAQIVFIENENEMIGLGMYATVRFGMDGA